MNKLKKTSCFLTSLILCLGLCGCNSDDKSSSTVESVVETTEQQTTEAVTEKSTETKIMTYTDSPYNIYAYFKENLNFIGDYIEYDEKTDPNESLGKEGSYIAKLNFELNYIQPGLSITPDLGASIEIFNNSEDAQKRSDYLNKLSFTKDQGNFVCENIVLRITEQAKAKDMLALKEAFLEFMQSPKKYEKTTESQNELNDHFTVNNVEFDINKSWKHVESNNNYYWYADDNSFITFTVIQSSISDSDKSDSYLNDLARAIAIEADNFTNQESIKINDKYDAIKFNCEINNVQAIMCVFVIDDKSYSISATTNLGSGDTIMNHYIDKVIESIKINKTEKENPLDSTTEKPAEDSKPTYEDENVKITYTGIEESYSTDVKFTIENKSDKKIIVQARDVSVNGIMTNPIFSCNITPGKKANDSMSFYNLQDDGIDSIETIELSFHIYDSDSLDKIIDTEAITIDVSK